MMVCIVWGEGWEWEWVGWYGGLGAWGCYSAGAKGLRGGGGRM